jgi:hypothetical protein
VNRAALACCLSALVFAAACSGSSTSSSTTTPTSVTTTTDVVTGTVPAPVNGALQSAFNPFTVGQSGGTVTVTLTSAVETLPNGTLLTNPNMGLGIGTLANGVCTLIANDFNIATPGSQFTGTLAAGSYCVQLSDVSNQLGPVAYAAAINHP